MSAIIVHQDNRQKLTTAADHSGRQKDVTVPFPMISQGPKSSKQNELDREGDGL